MFQLLTYAYYFLLSDKVKHICSLSRTAADTIQPIPNLQCGRIFSDAPALIRHEKRAHNFYRRSAKAKDNGHGYSRATRVEATGLTSSEEQALSYAEVPRETGALRLDSNLSGEKVHVWLREAGKGADVELDWDSDNKLLPRAVHSRAKPHGSHISYGDHSSTSASDAESGIISSGPSSIAAPPSPLPVQTYIPPPSSYPPSSAYNAWQYCPGNTYASSNAPANLYNIVYEEQSASYATQNSDHTVNYDKSECLGWLPPFVDMKRVLQNSTAHQGGGEWDGVVTGLSLVD